MACNLFIFNKVNSRFSLECHLLPYIPGCSPRERRAQPPIEPLGGCDYKPRCWLLAREPGAGGGHVTKAQRCTGSPWPRGAGARQQRVRHLRWYSHHPHPAPRRPDPPPAGPLKSIPPPVLQLLWLSPFLLPSHPWAHRSEPPGISPGPHAQFTDVSAEAQRGWLPWGLTHVTGRGGGRESCLRAVAQLATSMLTPRGFLVYRDPHKLRKALSEADLALGLSKECPHPPAEIQVLAFSKNPAGGKPLGASQQCQALSPSPGHAVLSPALSPSRGHSQLSHWPRSPPRPCPGHSEGGLHWFCAHHP